MSESKRSIYFSHFPIWNSKAQRISLTFSRLMYAWASRGALWVGVSPPTQSLLLALTNLLTGLEIVQLSFPVTWPCLHTCAWPLIYIIIVLMCWNFPRQYVIWFVSVMLSVTVCPLFSSVFLPKFTGIHSESRLLLLQPLSAVMLVWKILSWDLSFLVPGPSQISSLTLITLPLQELSSSERHKEGTESVALSFTGKMINNL